VGVEHFEFEDAGSNTSLSTRDIRHTIHMGMAVRKQTVAPTAEPVAVAVAVIAQA
jgi:hypothetical protein